MLTVLYAKRRERKEKKSLLTRTNLSSFLHFSFENFLAWNEFVYGMLLVILHFGKKIYNSIHFTSNSTSGKCFWNSHAKMSQKISRSLFKWRIKRIVTHKVTTFISISMKSVPLCLSLIFTWGLILCICRAGHLSQNEQKCTKKNQHHLLSHSRSFQILRRMLVRWVKLTKVFRSLIFRNRA